eukprot:TRINITY_DN1662_c0_g3_i5.p1 TRINITY_DN1662_c0_g3~~TRINITY_DN1662_c0_g3_i5.p1  ORF type:complete len:101 (+),score=22.85 TRINITY_DN1662_c0_g3_i5:133-435(+)
MEGESNSISSSSSRGLNSESIEFGEFPTENDMAGGGWSSEVEGVAAASPSESDARLDEVISMMDEEHDDMMEGEYDEDVPYFEDEEVDIHAEQLQNHGPE